jgi:hypothetical protein
MNSAIADSVFARDIMRRTTTTTGRTTLQSTDLIMLLSARARPILGRRTSSGQTETSSRIRPKAPYMSIVAEDIVVQWFSMPGNSDCDMAGITQIDMVAVSDDVKHIPSSSVVYTALNSKAKNSQPILSRRNTLFQLYLMQPISTDGS